jgi:branched-chain amino acid transport system permease protein
MNDKVLTPATPVATVSTGGASVIRSASLWLGVGLAALIALPYAIANPAHINLVILVLMAAQIGVAWNIIGGYAGQISLGHVAFYGIGAYGSVLLFTRFGVNPWIAIPLSAAIAAVLSLPVGWSCFRLKGHYFAMATIAVAEIVQIAFSNWEFAGASVGLNLPMTEQGWHTLIFPGKLPYYYLALGLLLLTLLANWLIVRSHVGFYLRAIKDEPDAARSLGVNISTYKQFALVVSSFFAAMGGGLYAFKELYIDPTSVLATSVSIKMALVSILGGVGTLIGPIVGAALLTLIEESSRVLLGGSGRGIDLIVYSVLIIAIAVYYPRGVVGWVSELIARRRARQGERK